MVSQAELASEGEDPVLGGPDEGGATVRGLAAADRLIDDPPADARTRLQHDHGRPAPHEAPCGREARHAGTDHDDVGPPGMPPRPGAGWAGRQPRAASGRRGGVADEAPAGQAAAPHRTRTYLRACSRAIRGVRGRHPASEAWASPLVTVNSVPTAAVSALGIRFSKSSSDEPNCSYRYRGSLWRLVLSRAVGG